MVSSAGLSAAYGGYQKARKADNEIEAGDISNQAGRTGLEADKAWGNTIPVLQQMLQPGAAPMPGAAAPSPTMGAQPPAPQAPPPGQSSQPMQAAPPERTMSPQGGGPPVGVYNQSQFNPMDAQAAAPPSGGQPQMLGGPAPPGPQGSPQGAPPAGAVPQPGAQGGGRLDLHTVMAAVVKANPGAQPAVIAAAVAKALPLMTAQSQMDYKNLMVQLSAGRLNESKEHHAATEDVAAQRANTQATNVGSQIERRGAQTEQGNTRLGIQQGREDRLAAQAAIRNDQRYLQLEQQAKALETRIQQGGDRAALSEWRAIVDAQHKRALELISSGKNAIGVMDPEERKALVKEQNDFYKNQIEQMRKGPARPERPAGADTTGTAQSPKTADRPPASGPPVAGARPQAVNPKTGEKVEFDGKAWVPVAAQPQAAM